MDLLSNTCIPPIIDDICVSKDEFGGKVKYFMVSEKKSQFFKLNEAQYNFFSEFLPYALNERDVMKLEEKCKEISDGKISLSVIYHMLQRYNLFDDNKRIKSRVTVDYNSKKIIEISLEELNKKSKLWKACFNILCFVSTLLIIITFAELIRDYEFIFKVLAGMTFSMNNINLKSLLLIFGISLMSIALHEIGHLLMAQRQGIEWKSISIAFIWGLSPIFYIRYKNFYIHKSKDKISVLLMGVMMNCMQVLLYIQLCLISDSWIFMVGVLINIGCIVSCIIPMGTSDGYQILAIVLGIEGARWKALSLIGKIIRNPTKIRLILNKREDKFLVIYILAAYVISVWGCAGLLKSVLHFFNIFNVANVYIFMIVTIFFVFSAGLNLVKFAQNVSAIK